MQDEAFEGAQQKDHPNIHRNMGRDSVSITKLDFKSQRNSNFRFKFHYFLEKKRTSSHDVFQKRM